MTMGGFLGGVAYGVAGAAGKPEIAARGASAPTVRLTKVLTIEGGIEC